MTLGKKTLYQSGIYFLGGILRNSISFIMLPIYTRVLTPADYGTIELLSLVIDFAGIIFGLRIGEAILRFYAEYEDNGQKGEVISTALILITAVNTIGVLIVWSMSGLISKVLFGGPNNSNLLVLFSLTLLFQPLIEIPLTFIRAQQRPWLYVSFSSVKTVLQLSLNIYLVVILRLGVKGVILSAVLSSGIISLVLAVNCLRITGTRFSLSKARDMTSFSYPMIFTSIISFYVTFGDRYFLKLYGNLADVGIYSLGYKFGFLLGFVGMSPFFLFWDSERYNILKKPDAKEILQKVFIYYTVFTAAIVVMISLFSKNIIIVMANKEFWGAYKIVPIILVAYFIHGMSSFCNLGIYIEKNTYFMTKGMLLSGIIITVFYILLIPRYGPAGAAWATLIAFFAFFLYIYGKAKIYYDMELPWKKILPLVPLCLTPILISYFGPEDKIQSLLINIILAFSFLFLLSMMPILPLNHKVLLRRMLLKPWTAVGEIRGFITN